MLKTGENKIGFEGKVHEGFYADFQKSHEVECTLSQILF